MDMVQDLLSLLGVTLSILSKLRFVDALSPNTSQLVLE
jgi:hypothetical protein